jgi:hypothetical protein
VSYPEDPTSSATPYGEAGDIFGDPDVVSSSPTTSERVVDTQSGYLVVLKRVDGSRVSLSVKRRIGTPPSSSILLTPDEQVKLAKILADAKAGAPPQRLSPRAQRYTHHVQSQRNRVPEPESEELGSLGDAPEREFARVSAERVDEDPRLRRRTRRSPPNRAQLAAVIVAVILVAAGAYGLVTSSANHPKQPIVEAKQAEAAASASEDARIDHFVRGFVADMLDFDPATYRSSQIHAMAAMTPELLDRYWQETNFPLSKEQLSKIPRGRTLIITKVTQEAGPEQTKSADLFAELASANSKISTPVHLRLKVGYGLENQLRVLDQKDLSTAK